MAQMSYHEIRERKIKQILTANLNKEEISIPIKVIQRSCFKNQAQNNFLDSDDEFEIDFDSQHQQVSSNPLFDYAFTPSENKFGEVAIISGLPGCGKSTIMKRIEEIAWMESQQTQNLSIPIRIQIENSIVSELSYQQQIIKYLNLDVEQYKQFFLFAQYSELSLLFLIDTDIEMTPDQFYKNLNILSTFKTYVKNQIKKYSQGPLYLINYEVQLFSEQQIQLFYNLYQKQAFQEKVEDIIKNYFQIQSFQQYQDQIITISKNLIEMKILNNNENLHQELIIQQIKQFDKCQNFSIQINYFEQIFQQLKSQVNQLQDCKQLKKLINHFQIEILLSIPKILKPLLQILIEEQITENVSHLKFFETILFNFLKIENLESKQFDTSLDSVKIFNFIMKFMELKSGEFINSSFNNYEILTLVHNPFKNTQYLNLIILNQGIINYLIANFIYKKILNVQDEKQDVCKINQISNVKQNELYFNEFDYSQLEYCKQIQNDGLFKRLDLSTKNYKGVVQMLKEQCCKNKFIIQKLLNLIKASSLIDDFQQEAGNAFTILCEIKGIIRNENFSQIKLKNSILNGTSFYECNFSCSEMENVSIICCQFVGCSLDSTRWNNIKKLILQQFNFIGYYNAHSHNQKNESIVSYSQNGQYFAQIIDLNKVMLHDFSTQENYEVLKGSSKIYSICISPNSMQLIACGSSELKILQIKTQKFSRLKINYSQISQIGFLNNEELVLHSYKKWIRIYNIKNQKLLRQYKSKQSVSFTLSPDHKTIVVVQGKKLIFFSLKTFRQKFILNGSDPLQFSSNSQLLAFTNKYEQICIYNINIKFQLMILELLDKRPQSISFSPDNQILAVSYSNSRAIYFQSLNTGRKLYIFKLDQVSWISFYNKMFAFGHAQKTYLLDFEAVKYASELENSKGEFTSFSLSGDHLAAGGKDHSIFLWDLEICKVVNKLKAHQDRVLTVSFTFDGQLLASGSRDKLICVWEIESRNLKFRLQGHTKEINSVIFTTDGKLLASGSSDQTARLWNMQTGSMIKIFNYPTKINTILIVKNDKILLAGGQNGSIFSTNLIENQNNLMTEHSLEILKIDRPIQSIIFTHDQSFILFSSQSQIILWDFQNNTQLDQQITKIKSIAIFEKIVISVYQDKIMIWQIIQNKLILIDSLQIFGKDYNLITFFPNQKAFITACEDQQNIQIWDLKVKLKNVQEFQENDDLQKHNNENMLIKQNIQFDQFQQKIINEKYEKPLAFSYSQDILASGNFDGFIFLWNVKTGQLLLKLVGHESKISCLQFSPTQSILISGSADKTVIVWDTEKAQRIGKLEGHKNSVTALVFSPNGQLIASGSKDGVIILWQVEKLSKLFEFIIHNKHVSCLDFSPNSKILVSLHDYQIVNFWCVEKNQTIYKMKKKLCSWIAFWTNNKVLLSNLSETFAFNIKTRKKINHTFWKSTNSQQGKFCQKNLNPGFLI